MPRLEVYESPNRCVRVEVDVFEPVVRLVGADGEQSDVDRVALAQFSKEISIAGITGKVDCAAVGLDDISAAGRASAIPRSPFAKVFGRNARDLQAASLELLPRIHLNDVLETCPVSERAEPIWEKDSRGSLSSEASQGFQVQVIIVVMRDQDIVDRWKVVEWDARLLESRKEIRDR
jgi:hypothetical protein